MAATTSTDTVHSQYRWLQAGTVYRSLAGDQWGRGTIASSAQTQNCSTLTSWQARSVNTASGRCLAAW